MPRPKKPAPAPKKSKAPYVVEYFTGGGEQPFYARLRSGRNNQILAVSEGYASKRSRAGTWSAIAQRIAAEIREAPIPEHTTV